MVLTTEQKAKREQATQKWRVSHRDQHLASRRARAARNLERKREQARLYRLRHPEEAKKSRQKAYARLRQNPEWVRARAVKAQALARKRKQALLEVYGTECACCHINEVELLTLDHIHGGGGEERKIRCSHAIYKRAIAEFRPDLFRILCYNCNKSVFLGKGICIHKRINTTKECPNSSVINPTLPTQVPG